MLISTKNIDATGRNDKRYAIKSTSTNSLGSIWGMKTDGTHDINNKMFDYMIIVKFDDNYVVEYMLEISWEQFFELKSYQSRMNNFTITITKKLKDVAKLIYDRNVKVGL